MTIGSTTCLMRAPSKQAGQGGWGEEHLNGQEQICRSGASVQIPPPLCLKGERTSRKGAGVLWSLVEKPVDCAAFEQVRAKVHA